MLKLTSSYSKKVPVPGADYSSQSFHAAVEVELPDGLTPEQLNDRIHRTFELVKSSVENELRNGHTSPATPPPVVKAGPDTTPAGKTIQEPPTASFNGNGNGNGNGSQKASGKQVQFLTDLAIHRNLNLRDLNALAQRAFRVADIGALTRRQASDFIDRFAEIAGAPVRRAA